MKKKIKKAFTLVELLVVIAILAILATVSIVGYNSFTKKAKVSNDTVLVKQMNDILFANSQLDGNNNTMTEALDDVFDGGYDLNKLTPTTTNYNIVWDSKNDQMLLLDEGKNVVYPENVTTSTKDMYLITKNADDFTSTKDDFAHYLISDFSYNNGLLEISTGLDVGNNSSISNITYTGDTTAKTVTIRTNGGNLTVNGENDVVNHYGKIGDLDVVAIAEESYHENGNVSGTITLSKGHFVVESSAVVSQSIAVKNTKGNVKVTTNKSILVVIEDSATSNVAIDAINNNIPVYVDDRTSGNNVTKPQSSINAIEISSESDFSNKISDFKFNNTMVDSAANVLNSFYKLSSDISVEHVLYVAEGNNAILDLNGHKLTSSFDGITILNLGNLVINDSSTAKTGIVHNNSTLNTNGNWSHDAVRNYGELTINGGTFGDDDLDRTNVNTEHRGAAVRNLGDCMINSGNFTCGDNYYTWGSGTGYSYAIRNSGNLVINNANLYGSMNGGVAADAGHVEINDGKFVVSGSKSYYVVANNVEGGGTSTINGGRFEKVGTNGGLFGGFEGMPSWDATDTLLSNGFVVNGGTFIYNNETITL